MMCIDLFELCDLQMLLSSIVGDSGSRSVGLLLFAAQ